VIVTVKLILVILMRNCIKEQVMEVIVLIAVTTQMDQAVRNVKNITLREIQITIVLHVAVTLQVKYLL
jgi:hypothetical protein